MVWFTTLDPEGLVRYLTKLATYYAKVVQAGVSLALCQVHQIWTDATEW